MELNTNKIEVEYGEKEMSVSKAFEIDEEMGKEFEKLRGNRGGEECERCSCIASERGQKTSLE